MSLRKELVEICHRVYDKGFVAAYDGNISVRLPDNTFLITRSGICKGDVEEDDILEIDSNGDLVNPNGKISTEFKIHLFAYSRRRDVNAVVHCHPVYATAFATAGKFVSYSLRKNIFPEVMLTLGKIPLCEYATPSTEEVPQSLKPYIDSSWAFLLQNHGAMTLGTSLKDAYYKIEKLEHAAKTIFLARMLGGEKEIPENKVKELFAISEKVYGIKKK